ncbi:MAG: NAD(P)/FAD-dependent oxidoreductase [Cyanobacteria bacterium]|nr:NAD(P)/FAD-dependent oxidoreductase [Cyanobacteriota bacterium]MDW8200157.1 NAD(P)/FAD-dependent oxidoreductase [Cyanobacteriota bacterium SKYGB_h_bin112]
MLQHPACICILGGGFGGLYTALRLSELYWLKSERPEIVLVDQNDRFVFLPLLYELMTGELQTWEIAPPYSELLAGTRIRFCQGTVTAIDIDQRQVQVQTATDLVTTLNYDRLVLALGGETPLDMVAGAKDHALTFRSLSDAYRLEERLRSLEQSDAEKIRVAIVGGGYSGVELACKLADRLGKRGRLRLIEQGDKLLRSSPDFNRDAAMKALEARAVWLDLNTCVDEITDCTITLLYNDQRDTIPVDVVLWTVGTRVHPMITNLPLKKNQRGQISTTSRLQAIDHPEIFALGDLADCTDEDGKAVPATAQAAFQQADYTAWNLWASLTDRPLLPFRYQPLGEMMTLGIDQATLTSVGLKLEGPLAYVIRRLAYLNRLPTLDHQLKVGLNWITRSLKGVIAPNL